MYGMPPAYHTRRSYVTLCEALCGRPRQTLLASTWRRSLGVRRKCVMGDIRVESRSGPGPDRFPVLMSPITHFSQILGFEDRHSQYTVSQRSIALVGQHRRTAAAALPGAQPGAHTNDNGRPVAAAHTVSAV